MLGENYIQVGLRGFGQVKKGLSGCGTHFRYHTMVEIERDGWDAVMSEFSRSVMGRNILCVL